MALFIDRGPWRLRTALLLSLLAHALLLSVTLGGQAFGLPGLNLPWKERRLGADELRITLAPAAPLPSPVLPQAAPPAALPSTASESILPSPESFTSTARVERNKPPTKKPSRVARQNEVAAALPRQAAAPAPAPLPNPALAPRRRPDVNLPIAPDAPVVRASANATEPGTAALPAPVDVAQLAREQEKQLSERRQQEELLAVAQQEVKNEQLRQEAERQEASRQEAARQELARQELMRREEARQESARAETARQDARKLEAERLERERQDMARAEAARQDALKQEATRQEQAKHDAARREQQRAEAARQEALKQESARQEQAKQDAARLEQQRAEAARQEALKQESARQEQAKQDAARQEQQRAEAARHERARQEQARQDLAQREKADEEAKREERLRAIGRQLNEEAAQRDPAFNRPAGTLPSTIGSARRGWLFGRADPNADLVQYAEAMSRKIEKNVPIDTVRNAAQQPHTRPVVTVAVRADGSVEKVTFVVSSGVRAVDESIRKIVESQAPYGAFSPNLARQYDVIEIRRTWVFDIAIRLE